MSDCNPSSNDDSWSVCRCPYCNKDLPYYGKDPTDLVDMDMEPVYVTLHFYYNDSDSMRRYKLVNKAQDMSTILFDLDQWLRSKIKYEDMDELQPARDKLWEFAGYFDYDIWED